MRWNEADSDLHVLARCCLRLARVAQTPEYSIEAIRYATSPDVPVAELVVNGPKDQKVDIAMVVWLIRGGGHTILFDSGFHRDTHLKEFPMKDYLRPDEAVKTAGVNPEDVTDIVISHAHWDHMGGIDLFPKATVWIQRDEYRYYTGDAWQKDGQSWRHRCRRCAGTGEAEHRRARAVCGMAMTWRFCRAFGRTPGRGIRMRRNTCGWRAIRRMCWRRTMCTST